MGSPVITSSDNSVLRPHTNVGQDAVTMKPKELFFSDDLYTPEALFSSWLNLSFFSVTTALLFYHMTQSKSIEADPRIAAILAIALMLISCGYVYFSVGPYLERMDYVAHKCEVLKECSDKQQHSINRHKHIYMMLGYGTVLVESIIAFLIIYKTRKMMKF